MKQIRIVVILAVICMILPLVSYAQEHRHSPHGEIMITNDTDSQVSFFITTEKYGRKQWTWAPNKGSFPTMQSLRLRVRGNDTIEIADWGKAYIQEVADFRDGLWNLSIRHARRELRQR